MKKQDTYRMATQTHVAIERAPASLPKISRERRSKQPERIWCELLTEKRRSPIDETGQGAKEALKDGSKDSEDCA